MWYWSHTFLSFSQYCYNSQHSYNYQLAQQQTFLKYQATLLRNSGLSSLYPLLQLWVCQMASLLRDMLHTLLSLSLGYGMVDSGHISHSTLKLTSWYDTLCYHGQTCICKSQKFSSVFLDLPLIIPPSLLATLKIILSGLLHPLYLRALPPFQQHCYLQPLSYP